MNLLPSYDAVVVGGGFFGASLAITLAEQGRSVLLCEKEADILTRASYNNQARIHNGYHYPRSILTALRSRVNFPKWIQQYRGCVVSEFEKYYAVARHFSKVTAGQFRSFMERIEAPLEPAPEKVRALFNPALVEQVFTVTEYAFDAVKLREMMREKMEQAGVSLRLHTKALHIAQRESKLTLTLRLSGGTEEVEAGQVFNCTYSNLNELLEASGLPLIRLKHELAEMALVEVPEPLRQLGITVMCGPFFSCMPFPARGLHTLSHVRYTPHGAWTDGEQGREDLEPLLREKRPNSHFRYMMKDAARYMPLLGECRHVDSLWEIKTVLPASEEDDSRPILFRRHCGLPNFHCVMGAKIDNIFDALTECAELF